MERPIATGVGFEKAIKVRKKLLAADAETAQAITSALALAAANRRAANVGRNYPCSRGSYSPRSGRYIRSRIRGVT
jgi:hypothetical protein